MHKKHLIYSLLLFCFFTNSMFSQKKKQPKLVVGIVVDQMRYDYLIRFSDKYGNRGFKKLIKKGFQAENLHYNYIPTFTAVGHASIFTGTTPYNHGIIGNNWYDKYLKKSIYCVDDNNYKTVGSTSKNGQKSPFRLQTTTLGDQLHLAQNMHGKTIGIAIKDRSAILPVGHTANGAYWFDGKDHGKWITSSFYMKKLPNWVHEFNQNGKVEAYVSQPWETYYDIATYTETIDDDNLFEGIFKGEGRPIFPHNIPKLRTKNGNYDILKSIPAGNTITTDFAIAAIEGEKLGNGTHTDFLSISYSSTDYVGHKYGVDSKEIEDTYIRMDLEIERLLDFLDKEVGKGKYTLFLTADHAVAQIPNYLKNLKIPADYIDNKQLENFVKDITLEKFGVDNLVENMSNFQIFINKETLKKNNLELRTVSDFIADNIIQFKNIYKACTAFTLRESEFTTGLMQAVQKGYNQKFSGDVIFVPNPATLSSYYQKSGTSHGSGYSYDTHVPMLYYGFGIKKGNTKKHIDITSIAPTISSLLQIEFPNGYTGKIVTKALK